MVGRESSYSAYFWKIQKPKTKWIEQELIMIFLRFSFTYFHTLMPFLQKCCGRVWTYDHLICQLCIILFDTAIFSCQLLATAALGTTFGTQSSALGLFQSTFFAMLLSHSFNRFPPFWVFYPSSDNSAFWAFFSIEYSNADHCLSVHREF